MRFLLLIFLFLSISHLKSADVNIDASVINNVDMRPVFDAFRAGQPPPPNRLTEINSSLVRMFPPLTAAPYGLGDLLDVVKGEWPNFTYDFDFIDNDWVEPVINQGAQVNLGYCFLPASLGSSPEGPPENYAAWEEFNYQWALHFNTKYNITFFEIWNEPDYSMFFTGSREDYFQMYKYAVAGIRRAVPDAKVGGPALAGDIGWVGPFLDFIIENKLPVNYISYHSQDNGYNDSGYYNRYLDIVSELEKRGMDSVTVHLNEFSYELDPTRGSTYDRSECAAWFAGTFKHILTNMPRLERFNKTLVNNGDLAPKWKYNGLIEIDNTPKAKFNTFKMYAKMPFVGIETNVTEDIDAMASINDSALAVMVWNKNSSARELSLNVDKIPFRVDSVDIYLIDPEHSSFHDNPETAELEMAESNSVNANSYNYNTTMREYSVYLFLLKSGGPVSSLEKTENQVRKDFELMPNYPNPFNSSTTISYILNKPSIVKLSLHDINGRQLSTLFSGHQQKGKYKHQLSLNNLSSSVYYLRLQANKYWVTRKILLLK